MICNAEQDGAVTLYLLAPDGSLLWNDSCTVEAGCDHLCRFLVPGLEAGQSYHFAVQDEVGKIWEANNVPVRAFAADMISMSLTGVKLSFSSLPEREYEVQWTPRLGAPWQTVTNLLSEGDQTSVIVPHPDPSSPSGFFRIRLE